MAGYNFWASPALEPKRKYRWILNINNIPHWIVKKVTKPEMTVSETPHKFLNYTFYYPGRVEFNKVNVTLVDPIEPDAAKTMVNALTLSGFNLPPDRSDTTTISKERACQALGKVSIKQLGPDDDTFVEEWVLKNAWISSVKFGDLDYDSEDMNEVELEIRYDWAELSAHGAFAGPGQAVNLSNAADEANPHEGPRGAMGGRQGQTNVFDT